MKIIIVGCGRFGAQLASRLFQRGYEIAVVDRTASAFSMLPLDFRGRLVQGEAISREALLQAGIEEANALVAVTNSDAANLVVSQVAKKVYRVSRVLARNCDPRTMGLYEVFGIQVISGISWGARRLEEILCGSVLRRIFSEGEGEVVVYEITVPEAWQGKPLKELINSFCSVVALTRGGKAFIPERDLLLEAGDLLCVSATDQGAQELQKRLLAC